MTRYVLGFAFDDEDQVVLTRKNRPEWQAGLLNGVGGHIEPHESAHSAMVPEFKEETNLDVPQWVHYANLIGETFLVNCYRAHHVDFKGLESLTDEIVGIYGPSGNQIDWSISNVKWLVHMALDSTPRQLVNVSYP